MKTEKVQELNHGLYKIFWKNSEGGGFSLASVGSTHNGTRWFAPTNWTSENNTKPLVASTDWKKVKKVELIMTRYPLSP